MEGALHVMYFEGHEAGERKHGTDCSPRRPIVEMRTLLGFGYHCIHAYSHIVTDEWVRELKQPVCYVSGFHLLRHLRMGTYIQDNVLGSVRTM
jgi:hypothetical protein